MSKLDLSTASVLITGGSAGIGLGLARRFLEGGARVLVTGRTPRTLVEAAKAYPGLLTFVSDIAEPDQRAALAQNVREILPRLNVVVNNAGVQRRVALAEDVSPCAISPMRGTGQAAWPRPWGRTQIAGRTAGIRRSPSSGRLGPCSGR